MVSFIKPSAAANMKQYLMPSYGEIMKHALTCKAIGAEVCSSVWCEFVLVKVNMNQLGVILYLNMYVCKFEPIQHVFRQKAFCKESILFHSYTLFYSLQRGQGIFIAINYTHVFSGDPFDGYGKAHRLGDHLLSASLGLSVRIGKTGWKRVIDARPYIAQNEWLSAYASSLSDSNSRYHAQHDRDCQTLEQLRKILAIEGLLDKYGHLFSDDAASSVTNGYPRNDYSGLNSLRARMRDKYGNGQKTKVMESASCTEEYGNAEGEPEDDYLSLIHSGKACIGAPIYFFFELGTDRLLNRSQLVNLDEVARIAKKYGLKVKVIGAADSATGSEAINDNLSRSRARFIAEELMKRGMENGTISQIFDGGIDDYSPNEANRHTRILLYL